MNYGVSNVCIWGDGSGSGGPETGQGDQAVAATGEAVQARAQNARAEFEVAVGEEAVAEEKIGELFGVPIMVDDSLPEGTILIREHRKGGRNMADDKEALTFFDGLRRRIAELVPAAHPVSVERYTYVCNRGDHGRLVKAVTLMYLPRPDPTIVHLERIAGVKIEVKPGVRAGGHFLDEKGKRVKED